MLEPVEYNKEEACGYFSHGVLGLEEEGDVDKTGRADDREAVAEAGEEELSPFQKLALRMVNVTEDGGVKKLLLKEGTGPVVPDRAQVTGQFASKYE